MGKLLLLGAGLLALGFLAGANAPGPAQEWSPLVSYNYGDIVLYQGKRYKWMLTTAARGIAPGNTPLSAISELIGVRGWAEVW